MDGTLLFCVKYSNNVNEKNFESPNKIIVSI